MNIHFIGIGGISMSGLAKFCVKAGYNVSGSDKNLKETKRLFKGLNVKILRNSANNISGVDAVVYSSAISDCNTELKQARINGIKIYKRSEFLGEIMKNFPKSIGVSGSHGKTTATGMIAHVLDVAGFDPTAFIGGEDREYSNFRAGNSEYLVCECCEYKKNFLDLDPKIAVVLNTDNDHMDSYGNMENMISAFNAFIKDKICIINNDDINSEKLESKTKITFGITANADYKAKYIRKTKTGYDFTLYLHNIKRGRFNLNVSGMHNVYNALCAIAVADYLNVPKEKIKEGLKNFSGIKRRNETIGRISGVTAVCDYAHHPTEIKAVLSENKEKCLVVFQPHTYSRTRILLNGFTESLIGVESLIIYKTYPAREEFDYSGSAFALYKRLKKIRKGKTVYAKDKNCLKKAVKENLKGKEKIIFLGAGDIYNVACKLLSE